MQLFTRTAIRLALVLCTSAATSCTVGRVSAADPAPATLQSSSTALVAATTASTPTATATIEPTLTQAPTATPVPPTPGPGQLIFEVARSGNSSSDYNDVVLINTADLSILALDGSDGTESDPERYFAPQWSPAGDALAYVHQSQLWIADPQGQNARQITDIPEGVFTYVWNDTGTALTIVVDVTPLDQTWPDPKFRFFLVQADGSGQDEVDAVEYPEHDFSSVIDEEGPVISVRLADGTAALLNLAGDVRVSSVAGDVAASPDGHFLAFVGECIGPGPDYAFGCPVKRSAVSDLGLIVVDLISGDVALMTTEQAPDRATTPAWSPDGQWIALATGDPQVRSSRNVVAVNWMSGDEVTLWSSADHWRGSDWDVTIDALAWRTSVSATGPLIVPTLTEMPVTDVWTTYTSERYGVSFTHPVIYGQGRYAACLPEDRGDGQIFVGNAIVIAVWEGYGLSLEAFVDERHELDFGGFPVERTDLNLGGRPAVTLQDVEGHYVVTMLANAGTDYLLNYMEADEICALEPLGLSEWGLFRRIVESFRLLP